VAKKALEVADKESGGICLIIRDIKATTDPVFAPCYRLQAALLKTFILYL
jgi:hypothetical protein